MTALLAALLLACAAQAEAAPHTLVVRMTHGTKIYSHAMNLEEGAQANFSGKPDGGGADRNMIVNITLTRAGAAFSLALQLELGRVDKSRTFQAQTSVEMRSGDHLTQSECGDWKVEIILDGKPGQAAPARGAWTSGGLENYRLTTDLTAAGKSRRCRQIVKSGAQSNIVDSVMTNEGNRGFILNALVAPGAGGFALQYQLEQSPFETQGLETLSLGSKHPVAANGGKISFLLEGAPPAAAAKAAPASVPSAAPPSGTNEGPVPLLR